MSPSIRGKKTSNSQAHVVKKRPFSVRVCVVLCMYPIVSRSCESSGSSCWPLHRRWQGVTPTRRADVQPVRAFRDVRLFVQKEASVRVCCICGSILPRSCHLAFVTSCNPFSLSGYSNWSVCQPLLRRASSYCMGYAYARAHTWSVLVYPLH